MAGADAERPALEARDYQQDILDRAIHENVRHPFSRLRLAAPLGARPRRRDCP